MKTTSPFLLKAIMVAITALGLLAGATRTASAHDGQWDSRHHYYRDNYGYWNEHDRYRHYVYWHNHHGYWDTRGPIRVFINVD